MKLWQTTPAQQSAYATLPTAVFYDWIPLRNGMLVPKTPLNMWKARGVMITAKRRTRKLVASDIHLAGWYSLWRIYG